MSLRCCSKSPSLPFPFHPSKPTSCSSFPGPQPTPWGASAQTFLLRGREKPQAAVPWTLQTGDPDDLIRIRAGTHFSGDREASNIPITSREKRQPHDKPLAESYVKIWKDTPKPPPKIVLDTTQPWKLSGGLVPNLFALDLLNIFGYLSFDFESHPRLIPGLVLRVHSWQYSKWPYEMSAIKVKLAACKASPLTPVLSLQAKASTILKNNLFIQSRDNLERASFLFLWMPVELQILGNNWWGAKGKVNVILCWKRRTGRPGRIGQDSGKKSSKVHG